MYNIENKELLGKIEDVFSTKSNDVYVIKNELRKTNINTSNKICCKKCRYRK